MRPHDMKYIRFKHQRENKQNSDTNIYHIQISLLLLVYILYSNCASKRLICVSVDVGSNVLLLQCLCQFVKSFSKVEILLL